MELNVEKLIRDCGGLLAVADQCEVSLQTVYRWKRVGSVNSKHLAALKEGFQLKLDKYFK